MGKLGKEDLCGRFLLHTVLHSRRFRARISAGLFLKTKFVLLALAVLAYK